MYSYVPKNQVKPYKSLCQEALEQLRETLWKQYGIKASPVLIGSGAQNLVTRKGNEPFDLDYNLLFTALPEMYESNPRKLKDIVRAKLDDLLGKTFSPGQGSTASLTYLAHSKDGKSVVFSFDVALIRKEKCSYRLIHDKQHAAFIWNRIFDSEKIETKARAIHEAGKWNDLRREYLRLKNMYLRRKDHDHPSYVVYIEAVNLVYNKAL